MKKLLFMLLFIVTASMAFAQSIDLTIDYFSSEGGYTVTGATNGEIATGGWASSYETINVPLPGADAYTVELTDSYGDGGESFVVNLGTLVGTGDLSGANSGSSATFNFTLEESASAPDPTTPIAPADLTSRVPTGGELSWNAAVGADGYYLYFGSDGGGTTDPTDIVDGTDLGNVTSYSYTDLGFLTTYYWAVVPYNDYGSATGYDIWEFETISETAVPFTINLVDSYGDGWNGGMLDVAVNGTVVLDDITIETGDFATFTFLVDDDDEVIIDYTAGDWSEENSYEILNDEDVVIYTSTAPPAETYSFIVGQIIAPDVFFSEYIEGSSNNKALEIYNGTDEAIDLSSFLVFGNYNGNPWSELYPFAEGTMVEAGDVYVMASDEADPWILDQADVVFAYGDPWYMTAFNGDDVRALGYMEQGDTIIVDIIGNYNLVDPGSGWDVAGVENATSEHTLVRKPDIMAGNPDWVASAGTDADDSEWIVYDQDTFNYLGWHIDEPSYISGTVSIDGLGNLSDATITAGDVIVNADETGHYFMNVVPGTYDVVAEMSGYDPLTESGVECVAGAVSTVDFALTVIPEDLWPPVNLTAEIDMNNVNVEWTAPTQYGWNGYYDGPSSLTWEGPERSVLFDVTDFGFSYPMELSSLSHAFYEHSSYPWGDDTTFTFKIYDADGTTVLYESEEITALLQWNDTIHDLTTPITVTDNFYVAVVPTGASGFPSSLFDADVENLHGYVGEPGAWGDPYADFAQLVYIVGEGGPEVLTYSKVHKDVPAKANNKAATMNYRVSKRNNSVKIDDFSQMTNSRDLLSFNIFRDDVQLNTEPVYDEFYVDEDVPAGEHTYYATALWNAGESGASNIATVNLAFGDLSGTVNDAGSGDPIEGAVIAAGGYSTTTIADGTYLIEDMLAGTYEINCSALEYVNADPVTVEILADETTVQNFVLEEAAGTIAFFDDFEGGADNWTFEETWGLSEEGSYSPTHCMTESPNANYTTYLDISATLAEPWDLSAAFGAELSFWYKSDIETGFDYMNLEISTNGTDWAVLAMYDEEDGEWQEETIPLGGFVGPGYETVSIRYRFVSDGGYETVGMLIDDVTLTTYDDDTFSPFIAHTGPTFYEGTPDDYVFEATIIDISGVAEANVVYTVDSGDPLSLPYTSVAGDVYTFTIPAQDAGAQVDYAVEAIDDAAEPNTGLLDGFVYIAGTPFIYDNGVVDYYTVFAEGSGAAELIINPAGNQLNLAYALIRNYTDQSGQDNDPFEFHVWSSVDGLPGEDLITPFVVEPEASYSNTSAMTRIDLRPYADELENIQGNFFIGFLVNQQGEYGKVHCTITQPGNFTNSYAYDAASDTWLFWEGTDLHFRAVAELIPVSTGTVDGVVTNDADDPIEGAVVTIGTSSATTAADGAYSIIADPGMQDVLCVADGYEDFEGSVEVLADETVTYDVEMVMILWAPQDLSYTYNDPNVLLTWEEPAPPQSMVEDNLNDGSAISIDNVSVGAPAVAFLQRAPRPSTISQRSSSTINKDLRTNHVPNTHVVTSSRSLAGYNVYRDGTQINTTIVPSTFYLDLDPDPGMHTYYVTAVYEDPDGESLPSNEVEVEVTGGGNVLIPVATKLNGNYPNPFNPTTSIKFSLKEAGKVSVNIYNMRGQLVKTLVDEELEAAYHEVVWNGKDNSGKVTASGVYFYRMTAPDYTSTKKMILMK